jgi:predicted aspartyl protease
VPTIEIIFLDRNDQPTSDRVTGRPSVCATVAIDGMEVLSAQPAVVDTGAEFSVINEDELSLFKNQVRTADKSKIEQPSLRTAVEDVYEGTITIHGLGEPVQTYFLARKVPPHMLIGRHVLEQYNMIYNPLGGVFSLES